MADPLVTFFCINADPSVVISLVSGRKAYDASPDERFPTLPAACQVKRLPA